MIDRIGSCTHIAAIAGAPVLAQRGASYLKDNLAIVPDFQSAVFLYEPLHLEGKVPAILNGNGHVGGRSCGH